MNELIFMVEEASEGGFVAPFLSASNSEPRTHNSELGEAVDSELPHMSRFSCPSRLSRAALAYL